MSLVFKLFDYLFLFVKNKGVGIFHHNGPAVVVRKGGNFPEAIGVEVFIVDHIKVDAFTRVVSDAEISDDCVNGAVVLHKGTG